MTINYAGTASDAQDGALAGGAFTWQVDFHHDTHIHPFICHHGRDGRLLVIPNSGETSANVWYRIHLTVRDSGGLTYTTYTDVLPRKVTITLAATVSGIQLTLDGQPVTASYSVVAGVVGIIRSIGAITTQKVRGKNYDFQSWSDGGAQTHNIVTPAVNTTYTANYLRSRVSERLHDCVERAFMLATPAFVPVFGAR